MRIDLNQICTRNDQTASRVMAGEAIVLTPMDSRIYTFNETGTRIWELLVGSPRIGDLIQEIHQEFNVTRQQAEQDVMTFVHSLLERGLVTLSDGQPRS